MHWKSDEQMREIGVAVGVETGPTRGGRPDAQELQVSQRSAPCNT
jgi:hypothetical protein